MECAGRGSHGRCSGPPTRLCSRCEAVAYCSIAHQISHWTVHKDECERLEQQMKQADVLSDFPFTFSQKAILQFHEKRESRCSFLIEQGVHQLGMWLYECSCGGSTSSLCYSRPIEGWDLSSTLSPCKGPSSPLLKQIVSWKDYYEWRCIPLYSPVALLLHWVRNGLVTLFLSNHVWAVRASTFLLFFQPLTLYWVSQLASSRSLVAGVSHRFCIHYLGPEKELHHLAAFGELHALFPGVEVHIDFVGPEIPPERVSKRIELCSYACCTQTDCECKSSTDFTATSLNRSSKVTIQLHAGFYHDVHRDLHKDSSPDLIVALNAGIAAYRSWLPTIELLKEMKVPTVFSDFCEEASCLAINCISSITGSPPAIPIQLNPFRHPLPTEDSALVLPCYSNCFIFGM